MIRKVFTVLHRWAGLVMALPLIIVALTGSLMAFHDEIDTWLNPDLFTVPQRDAPLLSGVALHEKAAALYPGVSFDSAPLDIRAGHTVAFGAARDPNNYMETAFEVFFDPYTGQRIAERPGWSGPSLARKNIMSYLLRVHFDLALPWSTGELGATILGITAIVWTLDCFAGLYLTFPRLRRVSGSVVTGFRNWLSRWKPAWLIKFRASSFRVNFDIHRAFGLWTWLILFIFAWSSVGLNENQIFTPVMHALLPYAKPGPSLPQRAKPLDHPRLDWQAAYYRGHALLADQARAHGFVVDKELSLSYDAGAGAYTLSAKNTTESEKTAQTWVTLDGDTGALLQSAWPGSQPQKAGDVITNWLFWMHTTAVLGRPWQIAVSVIGLVITALAITGIYIFWRKRRVRIETAKMPHASLTKAAIPIAKSAV